MLLLSARENLVRPMANDTIFGDLTALIDRVSSASNGIVVLAGAGLTVPRNNYAKGIPSANGIVELIRKEFEEDAAQLERFEERLRASNNRYQAAFQHLLLTRSQDAANEVIRAAVLQAYSPPKLHGALSTRSTPVLDEAACRNAEQDLGSWSLQPAVTALGLLLADFSKHFAPIVLTSNFDPLIAVAIRRAGGAAFTTALHNDGSLTQTDAHGCQVVHIHGDWFRSDTLHTPTQLGQRRPKLSASLARILRQRTLLVVGYGGWDDVFMRSLADVIEGGQENINVIWTFYDKDTRSIVEQNTSVFETLREGTGRGRVSFYAGIDAHEIFPTVLRRLAEQIPVLAKLKESYDKDLPALIRSAPSEPTPLTSLLTGATINVLSSVHYTADTNSKYLSFYVSQIAAPDSTHDICSALLKKFRIFLDPDAESSIQIISRSPGQTKRVLTDNPFSNLIYFYTESDISDEEESSLGHQASAMNLAIVVRGPRFIKARQAARYDGVLPEFANFSKRASLAAPTSIPKDIDATLEAAIEEHVQRALAQRVQRAKNGAADDFVAVVAVDDAAKATFFPDGFGDALFFMSMYGVESAFADASDLRDAIQKASPTSLRIVALGWGRWSLREVPIAVGGRQT